MRKVLIASAFGLSAVGLFTQVAWATNKGLECGSYRRTCNSKPGTTNEQCQNAWQLCSDYNYSRGFDSDGNPDIGEDQVRDKTSRDGPSSSDNGRAPSSHPKKVNGKTQRTADGRTIYVTSEGHEFASDGERIQVKVPMAGGPGTITVMVGDPDAPQTIVVNGQRCRAALPSCAHAYEKQELDEATARADKQAAQKKQEKANLDSARDKGGALQKDGTQIVKEDVDLPPRGSQQAGTSTAVGAISSPTHNATNAGPSTHPVAQIPTSSGAGLLKKKPVASTTVAPPASQPVKPPASNGRPPVHAQ